MTATFFDGHGVFGPVKPGTKEERHRARVAAAQLVVRNGGTPEDLVLLLDALSLWPAGDAWTPPADATPPQHTAS